jgi:hypothetical protein
MTCSQFWSSLHKPTATWRRTLQRLSLSTWSSKLIDWLSNANVYIVVLHIMDLKRDGIGHWSWMTEHTEYAHSPVSGSRIHNAVIRSQSSQHRMNGPLWSMSWKTSGHSDTGPSGCQRCIWSHSLRNSAVNYHMCTHMDSIMQDLAKKETQWKEDMFFAMKLLWQKLVKYYSEVTPMTDGLLISAH